MDSEEKTRMPLVVDIGTTSFATVKYTAEDIKDALLGKKPLVFTQEETCEVMPQVNQQTGQMQFTFAPLCEVRVTDKVWVSPDKINYWFYMDTSIDAATVRKIAMEGVERRAQFKREMAEGKKAAKSPIQLPGMGRGLVDAAGNPIKTPPPDLPPGLPPVPRG